MVGKTSESRLCAFCKLNHRVYLKKEVSFFDAALLMAVTGLMAFAIWGGPDLRSLIIFMSLAFLLQVFLRVRYRESVKCPHCGFDPILYNNEPEQAAQKVNSHMQHRKGNPEFLLKPQPKIQPIYRTKAEMAEAKALLSESQKGEGSALDSGAMEAPLEISNEPQPFL